jgi:hypothetical protein
VVAESLDSIETHVTSNILKRHIEPLFLGLNQ